MTDSPTRPLKVFLCHASADKSAVRKLYRYLRSRGIDPWLDAEKLLPGENWEVEIPKAIFDSDLILVCLSKNSVNKEGYVQKEIVFALDKAMEKPEGTIFIVPTKLEECDVPQRLNRYQWVDLYRDDGHRRLMLSLNKRAAQIGPVVEQVSISDDKEREVLQKAKREINEKEEIERNIAEYLAANSPVIRTTQKDDSIVPLYKPAIKPDFWHKLAELNGITVFSVLIIFVLVGITIFKNLHILIPVSSIPTMTVTVLPDLTKVFATSPSPTETFTSEPTIVIPTETPGIGSTMIGKDGMTLFYVPAGEFTMGTNTSDADGKPAHVVYLDAFFIDQTEVTNKMFSDCEKASFCTEPTKKDTGAPSIYYGNVEYDSYPVIYVDWGMANDYCKWVGRRLPTEAEWEKSARGTDAFIYPWGNKFDGTRLNYCDINCSYSWADKSYNDGYPSISPVGSYLTGKSFYGALDMAGNVWEWVADWYGSSYYANSPEINPMGPETGEEKVVRGGSWFNNDLSARSHDRNRIDASVTDLSVGFRCAVDANP